MRQPGKIKADFELKFKEGKRFPRKEDLICHPGYAEMEARLFAMMREEIHGKQEVEPGGALQTLNDSAINPENMNLLKRRRKT